MTFMFVRIALRNIRRNPRRTLLTIIAISFSLFCLIVFQALKEGLHREMVSGAIQLDAGSLQIHAAGFKVNQASPRALTGIDDITDVLEENAVTAYALRLKTPALILGQENSSSVLLSGVVPEQESAITFIKSKLIKGSYISDDKSILVSKALANALGKDIGEEIAIMVRGIAGSPVIRKFRIGGIYSTSLASFDMSHVYLTLSAAGSLLGVEGLVTEIAVSNAGSDLESLIVNLKDKLPEGMYRIDAWHELVPDVKQLIELNDATMKILIFIVFAIVAMGITNTMTTVIFERFREIGTLTAIGTAPSGIINMIVFESLFLGLAASAIGSLGGMIACSYFAVHGIDLIHLTSSNQYFASSHVLKAHLEMGDFVTANIITVITALLAGIYPAWKAARLEPVKALLHT